MTKQEKSAATKLKNKLAKEKAYHERMRKTIHLSDWYRRMSEANGGS